MLQFLVLAHLVTCLATMTYVYAVCALCLVQAGNSVWFVISWSTPLLKSPVLMHSCSNSMPLKQVIMMELLEAMFQCHVKSYSPFTRPFLSVWAYAQCTHTHTHMHATHTLEMLAAVVITMFASLSYSGGEH